MMMVMVGQRRSAFSTAHVPNVGNFILKQPPLEGEQAAQDLPEVIDAASRSYRECIRVRWIQEAERTAARKVAAIQKGWGWVVPVHRCRQS